MEIDNMEAKDIAKLSQVFDNTTATYKFYWMLAILEVASEGRAHETIPFSELVARMLAKAWQPLTMGRFSFGKCDSLLKRINTVIMCSPLNIKSIEERVRCYLLNNQETELFQIVVQQLTKYVPYRFLFPWVGNCSDYDTIMLSQDISTRCFYSILGKSILINPMWRAYIINHKYILEGFTYKHLYDFLARRNPDFVLPTEESLQRTADGIIHRNALYRMFTNQTSKAWAAEGYPQKVNVSIDNAQFLAEANIEVKDGGKLFEAGSSNIQIKK